MEEIVCSQIRVIRQVDSLLTGPLPAVSRACEVVVGQDDGLSITVEAMRQRAGQATVREIQGASKPPERVEQSNAWSVHGVVGHVERRDSRGTNGVECADVGFAVPVACQQIITEHEHAQMRMKR